MATGDGYRMGGMRRIRSSLSQRLSHRQGTGACIIHEQWNLTAFVPRVYAHVRFWWCQTSWLSPVRCGKLSAHLRSPHNTTLVCRAACTIEGCR